MRAAAPLLEIRGLSLAFGDNPAAAPVLDDVSINLHAGEIVGVVGESGSGKTMAARSVLRLWPAGARLRGGQVLLDGQDLLALPEERIRDVRGARIGMIFQEPMTSLNPALKVGFQLEEGLRRHTRLDRRAIRERVLAMLAELGMPDPPGSLNRHPHEFSGGMRQRLMIASAMCLRPQLLIADEPTTALDAIIARQVLEAMVAATRSAGTAVLLVSHDLSAVCHYAERIVVMRHGRVVETGTTERILLHPEHEYTRALLDALPRRRSLPRAQAAEQVVARVEDLRVRYAARGAWPWSPPPAPVLNGVSLEIRRGETLAVVGESGSGKSTLGRAVLGLLPACGGKVTLLGQSIEPGARLALELRRRAQLVFQDPYAALDPRMRVAALVAEGLRHVAGFDARERKLRVTRMLDEVGLEARFAGRYPHELSGGQRQRVVIARALVTEPDLIVADEPVSALDVTVQAQVLALLERLQQRFGFAMLFVSHDLSVVGQVADRIAIVRGGRVLEHGQAAAILDQPTHPYTRELWSAAPRLAPVDDGFRLAAANPPPAAAPAGYRFAEASDADAAVTVLRVAPGHEVLCVAAA